MLNVGLSGHFRKASGTKLSKDETQGGLSIGDAPFPTMSTCGAVSCLGRWAKEKEGRGGLTDQSAWAI